MNAMQDRSSEFEGAPNELRSPEAWLVTAVTRLCIDRLRAVRAERERSEHCLPYGRRELPSGHVQGRDAGSRRVRGLKGARTLRVLTGLVRKAPADAKGRPVQARR